MCGNSPHRSVGVSMAIATPEVYVEMLDRARAGSFAYPAVNVTSSQTLNAALQGFAEAESDGIIQVSVGGAEYASGPTVADGLATVEALGLGEKGRYMTALTFGNVHGVYKPGAVKLRPALLKEIQDAVGASVGKANPFDLVFHGGSGSSAAVEHQVERVGLADRGAD